jgi:branched-chain amino acid transport system permease protein
MKATVGQLMASKLFHPVAVAVVTMLGFFVIPATLGDFWVRNFTQTAIFAIVAASAGMLYGRVGLVSLGQVAPYGIGCWICMRFAYATDLPYIVLVLIGGVGAAIIGTVIGMPALRVHGLYLALVTLMLAMGVETLLFQVGFPNGGSGFKGIASTLSDIEPLRRPSFAETDGAYLRFVVVCALALFMIAWYALWRKPGRAWASVMQSEPSALTAGIDITRYKLLAFALASFMAGCAGGLFAGSVQSSIGVDQFNRQAALFLIAAVLMGGIDSLWGGLLAGILSKCLLDVLVSYAPGGQFWNDFSLSLFGFGLMMALIQGTKAMEKKGLLT